MASSTAWAIDRYVGSGGSFQAALDAAQPGDTITLQAGAVFTGNFVLPAKTGTAWITIQSSAINLLPAGKRVTPADAMNMPKIVAPNTGAAIRTANRARNYRIVGLEVYTKPGIYNWVLVKLGSGTETSTTDMPNIIELDRVYIHGDPNVGGKRGIDLNCRNATIKNSYISNFKSLTQDAQAIAGWNGPGPFLIENNYLEASTENIAFGGAVPSIAGLIPSDITIRRNHFFKPLSWKIGHPTYAGKAWWVKNLLEFKVGRRIRVEGNVFENNWVHKQNGFAILLTVRTESGRAAWNVIEDFTFINNIVRHVSGAFNLSGKDTSASNGGALRRARIENNVFEDVDWFDWGGTGRLSQILNATEYVTINHNTALQTGSIAVFDGLKPHIGFVYTNNITPHNTYGIFGSGTASGTSTLTTHAPGSIVTKNVIAGGVQSRYPAGNFFPASITSVGFVDLAGGNYALATGSPYLKAGTDGANLGANIAAVTAATAGVVIP